MLNLTRIDLAANEDKARGLDLRAALFKATTWEELKMLAKQNDFIDEAASAIHSLTQEQQIRLQCIAREDYYRRQRTTQMLMEQKEAAEKILPPILFDILYDYFILFLRIYL